eukprot:363815-Chlamydomonas_euryale.AAC.2
MDNGAAGSRREATARPAFFAVWVATRPTPPSSSPPPRPSHGGGMRGGSFFFKPPRRCSKPLHRPRTKLAFHAIQPAVSAALDDQGFFSDPAESLNAASEQPLSYLCAARAQFFCP